MVNDANVLEEYIATTYTQFNIDSGPLWNASLLPWSPTHSSFVDNTFVPAQNSSNDDGIPEPPKHRHVCHIILGFHHGIVDGHSCVRLVRNLLQIINDLISGVKIDDSVQASSFISGEGSTKSANIIERRFLKSPEVLNMRKFYEQKCISSSVLEQVAKETLLYGDLEIMPMAYCLDKKRTQKFIRRCKAEGVTVHSGFCTVINAAITRVVQNIGIAQPSYNLSAMHSVNTRKHHNENENAFGAETEMMSICINFPGTMLGNFWECARTFHRHFKLKCKHSPLERDIVKKMTGICAFYIMQEKETPPYLLSYSTSNMLDITDTLGFCGDNLQVEYIDWIVDCRLDPIVFSNFFQTLRGRLFHSLLYNRRLCDDATAQQLSKTIFAVVNETLS